MFWYLITCLHMRLSKLMTWSARGNICRLFGYPAIQPAVYRSDQSILPGLSDGLRGDFIPGMGMWIPTRFAQSAHATSKIFEHQTNSRSLAPKHYKSLSGTSTTRALAAQPEVTSPQL